MFSSPWHLLLFDRLGVTIIGTLTIIGGKAVSLQKIIFSNIPTPFYFREGNSAILPADQVKKEAHSVETPLKHGSRGEIFRRFAERRLYLHLPLFFFKNLTYTGGH